MCASEETPYTQNDHYFFAYRSKLLARYRSIYQQSQGRQGIIATLHNYDPTKVLPDAVTLNINAALAALANLGIHGLGAEDLARLLPEDDNAPALEIMAEVRAYFQGERQPADKLK